ncbi:MAG: hypothetical protein IK132_09730 [Clostridia bacterium]|nr:hypothetical protein [Clostridia bacterium]
MRDFEKDLKRAAAAYIEKTAADGAREEVSSSLEDRVGALLSRQAYGENVRGKEVSFMKKSRKWTAVIAAAALIALLGAAVAAGPIIRNFINTRTAQESVTRLEEVPEGWIGVYTVEDLDAVREDLGANYILMEDLAFAPEDFEDGGRFAGGWKPIGTERNPFIGTFNGNGHVIRGLVVTNEKDFAVEETVNYVGLFGYCKLWAGWDCQNDLDPEYAAANGYQFFERIESGPICLENVYIKEFHSGYIKNLGIEDSRIVGVYDADCTGDRLFVGPVVGYSEYVINCYTKNVIVEASVTDPMEEQTGYSPISGSYVDTTYYSLSVGGVAGGCYLMDCCWSDASVTVTADDTDVPSWHIGGLSGYAVTCITSYFNGTVDAGTLPDDGMVYIIKNDVPHILPEPVLLEIDNRLTEIDGNKANKFRAFYTKKDVNLPNAFYEVAQDLMMQEPEEISVYYVLDPDMKPREYAELSGLIGEAFPDGGFEAYCRENGIKYGCYYVYDLRTEPDAHFEGFDSAIWNVTPGERSTLKIFG